MTLGDVSMRAIRPAATARSRFKMMLLALLAASPAQAANPYDFGPVEEAARKAVAEGATPSVAFAIAKDGQILHQGAFGFANREEQRPATVRTAYPLASATKPITATALMVLHEDDGLALDTDLRAALPDLKAVGPGADGITLTQLLTHTAGFGTYVRIRHGAEVGRAPSMLDDVRAHAVTVNPPGRIAEYSNLGYGLLGEIAAVHAGRSFAAVVEERVFKPLGMDNAFIDTPRTGQIDVALPYDSSMTRLSPLRNNTPGAGNAYASVTDLIRFAMLHAGIPGKQLLSTAVISMMQARHGDAFHHYYGDAYYGLGWYVRTEGIHRVVWHEGGMPGASSIVKLLPEQRLAVVVLGNSTDANALTQGLANQLIQAVIPDYVAEPLDPVAGYAPLVDQPGFAGTWRGPIQVDGTDVACTLTIAADGAVTLRYQAPGQAEEETTINAIVKSDSFISALPGRLLSKDITATDDSLLLLKLVRTGDTIRGAVVAYASPARLEYLLPYPVELRREPTAVSGSPATL